MLHHFTHSTLKYVLYVPGKQVADININARKNSLGGKRRSYSASPAASHEASHGVTPYGPLVYYHEGIMVRQPHPIPVNVSENHPCVRLRRAQDERLAAGVKEKGYDLLAPCCMLPRGGGHIVGDDGNVVVAHASEGAKDAPGNDERLGVFDDHSSHLRVPPRTGNAMDGEATVSKAHPPAAAVHLPPDASYPSGFDGFFGGPFGPCANELPDIQTNVGVLGKVLRIHRAQMEIASRKRQQTETRRQRRQEEEKEEEECVPGTPRGNILEKEKRDDYL